MTFVSVVLRYFPLTGLILAASILAEAPQCSDSELALEDEALGSSTLLLQAGLQQSRGLTAAGVLQARVPAELYSMLAHGHRGALQESGDLLANMTDLPEDANDLWPVLQLVNSGKDKDASDPLWASVHELIRRYLKYANSENEEFVSFCKSGDMQTYSKKACAKNGQKLINGIPADRYFCGSRLGIDWGSRQVNDLCKTEIGSAYTLKGLCGSLSKKQLVMNVLNGVSKWKDDPKMMNLPSVACIMGVADCDIHFCQHCSWTGCARNSSAKM
eukprot:CAMPEP_0181475620 /NCGR_PEP_ID=MMETSP1110-20121109/41282_1 /TAXON_ID=174948 /ORGANISM="Symbiodinium sp., Strain CCMP421" /LENGTH=272 /DNA_ID=CAMNT_0023600871 /DNA_START=94 /DNA_END=912 /DNA_ORIENTATION=+